MLIKNGLIITLDPERRVISNGAVIYKDDRIIAVGKSSDLEKEYQPEDVIDATRKIIMPGLVNAHAHTFITTTSGLGLDKPHDTSKEQPKYFWDVSIEQHFDRDVCYAAGMLNAVEMLHSGITTTQDSHYAHYHRDAIYGIAQAVVDSGMRTVLGRGSFDTPGLAPKEFTENPEIAMQESEKVISAWHGKANGRINIRIEATTLAQCSNEMIQVTHDIATKHNLGWVIHVQAPIGVYPFDLRKTDPSMKRYNGRAIELLQDLGVLGPSSLLIHCTYVDSNEIDILAKTQTPVTHCPVGAALGGKPDVAPIPEMLKKGVIVGLGTDGPSNGLDLFQSMKACAMIHKMTQGDPMAMTAEKVLEMSTINGAKAMQLDKDIGSLEVGKKADIILLDLNSPGLRANLLPVKNLIYSAANGNAVDTVIIDGNIVMENRKINSFDEQEIYQLGEEVGQRIIKKSGHLDRDPNFLKPTPWKYI